MKNGLSFRAGGVCAVLSLLAACASVGNPDGGPYDERPPRLLQSTPREGELNYRSNRVTLLFDELVMLDKPSENVIVTPPQMKMPVIQAVGRRITVELRDTLLPEATYTIDFTSAITDNNEKNPLENFALAFATGSYIDTLAISGQVLNAEDLEPLAGITVGLHTLTDDTAFLRLPFVRTSRTNERGRFTIRNMAPGAYRLFALNDVNRDYRWSPSEGLAFADSLVVPSCVTAVRRDTVWADSLRIDSVQVVEYTRFVPDDLSLLFFESPSVRHYLLRPERPEPHRFVLRYSVPPDTVPLPQPVGFSPSAEAWYLVQTDEGGAATHFWITDSTLIAQDTLQVSLRYAATDSSGGLSARTDTLRLVYRPPLRRRAETVPALGVTVSAAASMNLFDTLAVTFTEPVLGLDTLAGETPAAGAGGFRLEALRDTVWESVPFGLRQDGGNCLRYLVEGAWQYGAKYRLTLDSARLRSIYGRAAAPVSSSFAFKPKDQYGQLSLEITLPADTMPAYIELIAVSGKAVRRAPVTGGRAVFADVPPAKYFVRLVMDADTNGRWDGGDFLAGRQPERVAYRPEPVEVMKNWELTETWDLSVWPPPLTKPLEITKNRPKPKAQSQQQRGRQGTQRPSSSPPSLPGSGGGAVSPFR